MKVRRLSNKRTRIAFENEYESAFWFAQTNENGFCFQAALNLYKTAAREARTDSDREQAISGIKRCECELIEGSI